mmetsp:Transcript_1443/g.3999  ORF Transcript_1443/g.3999 Transcript_1443/m.3999 type:complete len:640 (+) Transcript_1443:688-2607(+)
MAPKISIGPRKRTHRRRRLRHVRGARVRRYGIRRDYHVRQRPPGRRRIHPPHVGLRRHGRRSTDTQSRRRRHISVQAPPHPAPFIAFRHTHPERPEGALVVVRFRLSRTIGNSPRIRNGIRRSDQERRIRERHAHAGSTGVPVRVGTARSDRSVLIEEEEEGRAGGGPHARKDRAGVVLSIVVEAEGTVRGVSEERRRVEGHEGEQPKLPGHYDIEEDLQPSRSGVRGRKGELSEFCGERLRRRERLRFVILGRGWVLPFLRRGRFRRRRRRRRRRRVRTGRRRDPLGQAPGIGEDPPVVEGAGSSRPHLHPMEEDAGRHRTVRDSPGVEIWEDGRRDQRRGTAEARGYVQRGRELLWYAHDDQDGRGGTESDRSGSHHSIRPRLEPADGRPGPREGVALRPEERRHGVPPHHGRYDRGEDLPPADIQDGRDQSGTAGSSSASIVLPAGPTGSFHTQARRGERRGGRGGYDRDRRDYPGEGSGRSRRCCRCLGSSGVRVRLGQRRRRRCRRPQPRRTGRRGQQGHSGGGPEEQRPRGGVRSRLRGARLVQEEEQHLGAGDGGAGPECGGPRREAPEGERSPARTRREGGVYAHVDRSVGGRAAAAPQVRGGRRRRRRELELRRGGTEVVVVVLGTGDFE